MVDRNRHAVATTNARRCCREALAGLAGVVQAFGHEGHRVAHVETQLAIQTCAVKRPDQTGILGLVVDVGRRHIQSEAISITHEGLGAEAADGGAVLETTRRGVAAQALQRRVREMAITGQDFLVRSHRRRDEGRTPVAGLAPQEVLLVGEAVALVGHADIGTGLDPVKGAVGDDVDHAGDRIGTVNGGGAVQQHFHPLDCRQRNRVEVDEIAEAARARAVHPAPSIDQHQRAVGTQVAQVHRTGPVTGAAGAGRVEA